VGLREVGGYEQHVSFRRALRRGGDHRSNAALGKLGIKTFSQNCLAGGIRKVFQTKPLQAIQIRKELTFDRLKRHFKKYL
jgi:hypothetical protein